MSAMGWVRRAPRFVKLLGVALAVADIAMIGYALPNIGHAIGVGMLIGWVAFQGSALGFGWMFASYKGKQPEDCALTEWVWQNNKRLMLLGAALWCAIVSLLMLYNGLACPECGLVRPSIHRN